MRYVASVFVRNCGATTDYALHVNLRPREVLYHVNSNGTVSDGCIFLPKHAGVISLDWRGTKYLVIQSDLDEAVVSKRIWRDVTVSYQNISKPVGHVSPKQQY